MQESLIYSQFQNKHHLHDMYSKKIIQRSHDKTNNFVPLLPW